MSVPNAHTTRGAKYDRREGSTNAIRDPKNWPANATSARSLTMSPAARLFSNGLGRQVVQWPEPGRHVDRGGHGPCFRRRICRRSVRRDSLHVRRLRPKTVGFPIEDADAPIVPRSTCPAELLSDVFRPCGPRPGKESGRGLRGAAGASTGSWRAAAVVPGLGERVSDRSPAAIELRMLAAHDAVPRTRFTNGFLAALIHETAK
jgi:hypothetical protein